MTPEEFRQAGHKLIDWIADYRQSVESMPVRARVEPNQVKNSFELTASSQTVDINALLSELEQRVVPGITQVQHPMYYGWFPSNASLSSVLGDIASSGLGTLGISWESCPALTEVEEVVCDWMRQLVGLSKQWQGVIQDTASTSSNVCLIAAREKATQFSQNAGGLTGFDQPLTIYCTTDAHSSVVKAALLAGFGMDYIRNIEVDLDNRAMNVDSLKQQIQQDIDSGCKPAAIVATTGTTGTTAIDPIEAIAAIAKQYNCWLHVDAAMAGAAMILPECRYMWQGIEQADSLCWNPHKWFGTILDCSLMYVKDSQHLIRVMSTNPSYLQSNVDLQVTQYRDWSIPLGRRFRSLKILFQLRLDGIESIQTRLRNNIKQAQWLASQFERHPEWEVVAPVILQTLCVRHIPQGISLADIDQHTRRWAEQINASGKALLTPAKIGENWVVRISIGAENTTDKHVEELWQLLQQVVNTNSSVV